MTTELHTPDQILEEWFSDPDRWWRKDPAFDRHLEETYGADVEAALAGELDSWAESPRTALALVLLLDQWTRNVHRGTPRMFAGDRRALEVTLAVIERGEDEGLEPEERHFLYMPLMHSEDPELQKLSLEKFGELGEGLRWARDHADIVFRFGRYPHRNEILGRESTPEEIEFLKQPGSSF